MQKIGTYLLYGAIGFATGMAASMLVCGVCSATVGDVIIPKPPDRRTDDRVFLSFFVAELAAPFAGMLAGLAFVNHRHRRPPPLPPDNDDIYPPV